MHSKAAPAGHGVGLNISDRVYGSTCIQMGRGDQGVGIGIDLLTQVRPWAIASKNSTSSSPVKGTDLSNHSHKHMKACE